MYLNQYIHHQIHYSNHIIIDLLIHIHYHFVFLIQFLIVLLFYFYNLMMIVLFYLLMIFLFGYQTSFSFFYLPNRILCLHKCKNRWVCWHIKICVEFNGMVYFYHRHTSFAHCDGNDKYTVILMIMNSFMTEKKLFFLTTCHTELPTQKSFSSPGLSS